MSWYAFSLQKLFLFYFVLLCLLLLQFSFDSDSLLSFITNVLSSPPCLCPQIDHEWVCKLCDFGEAVECTPENAAALTVVSGTLEYLDPVLSSDDLHALPTPYTAKRYSSPRTLRRKRWLFLMIYDISFCFILLCFALFYLFIYICLW